MCIYVINILNNKVVRYLGATMDYPNKLHDNRTGEIECKRKISMLGRKVSYL